MRGAQVELGVADGVVHGEGVPVQRVHADAPLAGGVLGDGDVHPHEQADRGHDRAQGLGLVGDEVPGRVGHPHAPPSRSAGEQLVGLGNVRVGGEEHVNLPGVCNGLGVLLLRRDRIAGVLLADLGVEDHQVRARLASGASLVRRPLDIVEVDGPRRVRRHAVEAVGR
ncbi:MAG: hypothetical protein Q605_AUC00811G0002 [Actinomyces urogenitalis DORA_12]|uniref:Uncharacterized protein n=1 Tax=Actinomyces urogenitalis DORA_12 TaxID=1403939 RepID=W1VFK0_9ACTO|nr:MAG: hypothetical protein Q605_AUC00811G0002 [Actinomyces urogenitalis DORA_12]